MAVCFMWCDSPAWKTQRVLVQASRQIAVDILRLPGRKVCGQKAKPARNQSKKGWRCADVEGTTGALVGGRSGLERPLDSQPESRLQRSRPEPVVHAETRKRHPLG